MNDLHALILAAGEGTRMKSGKAKVLHEVGGRTLLDHVIKNAREGGADQIGVIIGHQKEAVKESLPEDVSTYVQEEQLGTGHAVMQAAPFFEDADEDDILILCGDAPLVRPEAIEAMEKAHKSSGNDVTVMSAIFENPFGYGRIVRDGDNLLRITEQKDCTEEEKKIQEINSGIYLFKGSALKDALGKITTDNAQNEYYLTDAIEIIRKDGGRAGVFTTDDKEDIAAVN